MGIVNLNRFLIDNCRKSSIHKQKLSSLRNKTIVIDTSIYLYKYASQNALFENFYMMISLLRENNITPLFVFDGKPPPEKYDLLDARKLEKKTAEQEYKKILSEMESEDKNLTSAQKKELQQELDTLKNQFIRIRPSDIRTIKKLMDAYGVMYRDAEGEADEMCAALVLSGKAWACMSDDMDMLVYGCPRVLRHFSIAGKTVLIYHMENILTDLRMDMDTFRKITVLSGTDYNIHLKTSLVETMKWYEEYIRKPVHQIDEFYQWLHKTTKYIHNYDKLISVYEMFSLQENALNLYNDLQIQLNDCNLLELHAVMKEDGFVIP